MTILKNRSKFFTMQFSFYRGSPLSTIPEVGHTSNVLLVKSSQNMKDLNDVTAAAWFSGFSAAGS